jgi:ferric-dicitrate binding protein FerR (iron transport regulator)
VATSPERASILAAIQAGVLALRRRLHVVTYILRPARSWRFPLGSRPTRSGSAGDPGVLLERYLVSDLGAVERDLFESWLAKDPDRVLTVEALRNPRDALDASDWWVECRKQMRLPESEQAANAIDLPVTGNELRIGTPAAATIHRWHMSPAWIGLAASMLCVSLGVWARSSRSVSPAGATHLAEHSYETTRGERAVLTLDGATVVLGPESVLRIAGSYGLRDRTVSLTGHAYFDVTHDAGHPFRVWAGGVLAEDIGTRFDIRAYARDSVTRLVVADGAVAMRTRRVWADGSDDKAVPLSAVLVTRGMMATAGADGVVRVRSGVATDRYLSWSDGRLAFDDTPLPEVVAELSRWYDLDIRLGDPRLASRTLTASFDDPPAAVLVALEGALGVRVARVGRVVTLYPP